jgi:hypothetical protein
MLLGLVCLFCHGLLLTNDGLYWDGWYVFDWVKSHNWAQLHHFYNSLGLPFFGLIYRIFAFAPSLLPTFMWATVICFFASGVLTYHLGLQLAHLTRAEALAISLLTVAMPLFTAAQEFIMFCFIFTHALSLFSAWVIARALGESGPRQWFLRVFGVLGFVLSFSNAALLVYYGGFYLLFFFSYRRRSELPLLNAGWRFVRRFPELLLLPPVTWYARSKLTPQYGWYAQYNEPLLSQVPTNMESFFRNVPAYTFNTGMAWIRANPVLVWAMVIAALLWYVLGPRDWRFRRTGISTFHFVWFGAVLLVLAVLPFAAAGKYFWPTPISTISRHCILTPLPAAILVFAVLRLGFTWCRGRATRLFPPVLAFLVVVLAVQVAPVYLKERVEWIYSLSLLSQVARSADIRDSSVVVVQSNDLAVAQTVYGLYAFKIVFGGMDRFVTNRAPANGVFYTPSEIESMLVATSMLPSEFARINRQGRQVRVETSRNAVNATDWQIVRRYLRLRYFGSQKGLQTFLDSLCTIKTSIIQSPLPQAAPEVGNLRLINYAGGY